ncbi:MAG: 50S ribosomal protein L10 [Planctomycetaceae bacterium]
MSKIVKNMLIADVEQRIGATRDFLVVDSSRIDAVTTNRLRLSLRERNITALTVRNALAKRALHNIGVETLDSVLEGPCTLVWGGDDIVALSKEIARWAKDVDELEIKGGTLDGAALSADEVKAVSQWPTREELLSIVSGQVLGVAGEIAGMATGPAQQIASQVETLIDRLEAGNEEGGAE